MTRSEHVFGILACWWTLLGGIALLASLAGPWWLAPVFGCVFFLTLIELIKRGGR